MYPSPSNAYWGQNILLNKKTPNENTSVISKLQTYSRQALVAIAFRYAPICSVRYVLLLLLALLSWRETATTALHIGHFIETMPFDPRNKSNNLLFLQQGQATWIYSSSTLCTSLYSA